MGGYPHFFSTTRCYDFSSLVSIHLGSPWFRDTDRKKKTFSRKCRDLPGSWVTLCACAALYDPGRIFVPSHEDKPLRGVASCRRLSSATHVAAGASVRTLLLSRRLAAPRCCPRFTLQRGLRRSVCFRGSITRPQRSLSTLRSLPRDRPRKTRLSAGGQPLLRGFGYPPGHIQGFSLS